MTNVFYLSWAFIFGLIFGSFSNVLILRDDRRKTILTGRSECMHCQHELAWFDLVPVLSFLSVRGKCRYCGAKISPQYPIIEILSGLLAVFAVKIGLAQDSLLMGIGLYFSLLLFIVTAVIDLFTMEVPIDYLVLAGLIGGFSLLFAQQNTLPNILLGVAVGAGSIAIILYGWKLLYHQDGMGVGDIWIAGAMGAVVGFPQIFILLMAAVFSGAIIGVLVLLLSKSKIFKKGLQTAIPFGPFLFLGLLIALQYGQLLIRWYSLS